MIVYQMGVQIMIRLMYYFATIWVYTKQLFGDNVNKYWTISEENYNKYLDYEQKVIELKKENKTYKSLCKKFIKKIQEQKDLIDLLTEDKENNCE